MDSMTMNTGSDEFVEAVLSFVESIPAGSVLAYGDIASFLGAGGPRQIGAVLSRHGGGVPWWRVPHADGSAPPGKDAVCARYWRAEGTPLRANGRVDMAAARWTPDLPSGLGVAGS